MYRFRSKARGQVTILVLVIVTGLLYSASIGLRQGRLALKTGGDRQAGMVKDRLLLSAAARVRLLAQPGAGQLELDGLNLHYQHDLAGDGPVSVCRVQVDPRRLHWPRPVGLWLEIGDLRLELRDFRRN